MRLLIIICILISTIYSQAARERGLDYRATLGARSLPFGGALFGEAGYGIPVWGDWEDQASPWYGFVRPVIGAATALTINEVSASLRVHPVSFVGLGVGHSVSRRSVDDSENVDCSRYLCDRTLNSQFAVAEIALAAGQGFLLSELEYRDIKATSAAEEFYEDAEALIGSAGRDSLFSNTLTLGLRELENPLLEHLLVGITAKRVEMNRSNQESERLSLVVRHSRDELSFSYAAGVYKSSVHPESGVALGAAVTWTPRPGLIP